MKVPKNITYPFIQQTIFGKVKIYKGGTEEVPDYTVSWVSAELGRQKKTFRDRDKAFLKMEELIDDFQAGKISRKNVTTEKAMFVAECEEMLKPYGATLSEAVRFFVEHKAKTSVTQISTADAVAEYLKRFDDKRSRHYRSASSTLKKFGRHFLKMLDKITVSELDTYFKSVSPSGKTRNNHLCYVRTFFKWAQDYSRYLPEGKMEIDKIKEPYPVKKSRPNPFTPEEIKKILYTAEEKFIPYLAIGAFAGVRSAEICRLNWEDIRIDQKRILLSPEVTKTQSGRLAVMPDNLVAWLNSYKGEKKGPISPYVEDQICKFPIEWAKAAGIAWKSNGLRKGYISACMAHADASAAVVAENCGNSPEMIKSNYRMLVLPDYAEAWFGVYPAGYMPPVQQELKAA
jgi:integrase